MREESQVQEQQSTILSAEQVESVVTDTPIEQEEHTLPSEQTDEQLLLGKFKSQDDLIKAYKELESKLGKPSESEQKQEEAQPKQEEVDPEYLEWKRTKQQEELLKDVGGVESYKKATAWARENLDASELESYNKAIEASQGNPDILRTLTRSLVDKYNNSITTSGQPSEPLHSGETTKVPTVKGYATKSDMMKDINDPRYTKDEAYRNKVVEKLAVTDETQWYKGLPRF